MVEIGRVRQPTIDRILIALRLSDRAMSEGAIRDIAKVHPAALRKVINYYIDNGEIEPIVTSNGVFYKWRGG